MCRVVHCVFRSYLRSPIGIIIYYSILLHAQNLLSDHVLQLSIRHSSTYQFNHNYEGWNFNFGNAAITFDTAHLQSPYFHRPSMYSPKLCRTRSQRWGSRMMPLATPVLLMVRTEPSTAEGLNPPCNCPIRYCCRTASLFQSSVTLLLFCPCLLQF